MTTHPDNDDDAEILRQFEALTPLRDAVLAVADFALPAPLAERFTRVGDEILRTPPLVARLTVEGGSRRDWHGRFTNAVNRDVREGLSASYYHLENVETLETEIVQRCADALAALEPPARHSVTGLKTRRLDYEYQAFRFALRRTLDYLAVGVAAFFKCESASINGLSKALKHIVDEIEIRDHVCARLEAAFETLPDVMEKPTVRDQIAHWQAVDAGSLNILWGKEHTIVSLASGGEKLEPWEFSTAVPPQNCGAAIGFHRLTPRLRDQVERIDALVFGVLADLGFPS